ncbi:hypothetical protein NQ314_008073 [Rhamnusium bicolor]|uniref:DNA-directed DNA polymerase n=1 Tax=Rhamnusium bicolor TaxID=1586634 RepID=A0AAV8YFV6_9CUCU|nr:hypothetical protein NQ314_008073 [Rhamnusium bicolor]
MASEEIKNISDQVVAKFKEVEVILDQKCTPRERDIWLKQVKHHIRLFNKAIRKSDLSMGALKKLQTNLGHLKRFKKIVIENLNYIGAGLEVKQKRSNRVKWEDLVSAFKSRVRTGVIINLKHKDLVEFFNDAFHLFKIRIINAMKKVPTLKVNTCFCAEFIRKSEDIEITEKKYFNTKNKVIDAGTDLNQWFGANVKDDIFNTLSEFSESGSGWALSEIISLEVNINKYEIGNGVSSYIKLPEKILKKHACINIKNDDVACFAWSIVSSLFPVARQNHPDRISSYPHYTTVLNITGIEFPMTLPQISKFEKNNDISVNVFGLEMDSKSNFSVIPVRVTKQKLEKHVNLLIIQDKYFPKINEFESIPDDNEEEVEIKYHYCYIKDLSRLLNYQISKNTHKKFFCDRCLNYFSSQDKLNDHVVDCEKFNDCKIEFSRERYIKFKNFVYKETVPFIIYADFESLLEPFNDDDSHCKTSRYQKHIAYSAGYYFKCSYNNDWSYYKSTRGLDCMSWFEQELSDVAKFVSSKLKQVEPMNSEVSLRDASKNCHICEEEFKETDKIVRDHCHLTGNFRGFAHNKCNLNYKNSFVIPVVFHNLGGYDAHFAIKFLAERNHITLLPENKEKYISFTVHDKETSIKFRFIDSFRFMGCSLEELASTLKDENFENLKREFPDIDDEKFQLLTRKGVFFYDYLDTIEKLDEIELPDIKYFYNKLKDENIEEADYAHAQIVWEKFGMKTLGDYSDLYMKTDIMLLTCIFETLRKTCHQTYGLDPSHYYTIPGYTWDCMLKYTGCKIETVQDVDILMFIEGAIRGGLSQCCNRFSEANNKYLDTYDTSKPSTFILYLDVNNLYGWAMGQPLPYEGFQWTDCNIDVTSIPDDAEIGYILEVDLEYPESLHDLHRDLPFCPEHQTPPNSKFSKLMTTCYNKQKYIIHYRNLKQAIQHGIKLTRIHRVLQFKQSSWLKPYIDLNTSLRAQAKSNFEKNNYKLMNNAVYGKTMQNVRKHRIVRLVNKWEGRYGAKNLIASPNFQSRSIFSDNLMAIEMKKSRIIFDKPLYIGMAILDISKICVYEFHHDYMLNKFPLEKCKLLYTDTDSLMYEIQCNDVYEDVIKQDIHRFDTSDYPQDNRWNIPLVNKKVPGLMKDENNGKIMTHFIGLRSKQYTYKVESDKVVKKAKGVKSNVVKNKITFQDYHNCIEKFASKSSQEECLLNKTQRCIQSRLHEVYSVEQTKIALNPFDDKRYILPEVHDTLPWGHYSIMNT